MVQNVNTQQRYVRSQRRVYVCAYSNLCVHCSKPQYNFATITLVAAPEGRCGSTSFEIGSRRAARPPLLLDA